MTVTSGNDKSDLQKQTVSEQKCTSKANKVVGCVCGIGERKWGGDFRRIMMMFESMVESILMYGVRGRDLGMEGRRRGRESARQISI
jgi:hypothetical protein